MSRFRNALMQLFVQNMGQTLQPLNVVRNEDDGEATIYLYDAIGGFWGIDAQEFARQLVSLTDVDTIHLRVNSPGGDVFDARAMQTAIAQHSARVVGHIDGLAASAATFLLTSADEVEMSQGSGYMIHNGWSLEIGDRHDHRAIADVLEGIDQSIVRDLNAITNDGVDTDQLEKWMDAETWFTADEALEHGFVSSVFELTETTENRNKWNLTAYKNAPEEWAKKRDNDAAAQAQRHRDALSRRVAAMEMIGG